MAFFDIIIEQYKTYSTRIEADSQREAERIGRELLPALNAETDDVIVQARELHVNSLRLVDKDSAGMANA